MLLLLRAGRHDEINEVAELRDGKDVTRGNERQGRFAEKHFLVCVIGGLRGKVGRYVRR